MNDVTDSLIDEALPRARLALLLEHFSRLDDERESWRVMYPLSEVLLLLTCATIASCDDFDDIAAWGRHHLERLRRFSPFHFGIPSGGCARWSTVSIRSCSGAVSRTGSRHSGPAGTT